MEKLYIVYEHLFPNRKRYIGITCRNPKCRWGKSGNNYTKGSQPILYNAINKYGWDNIIHNILFKNLTKEEACIKEKELIEKYKTNVNKYGYEFGYNLTDGGDGVCGFIPSEDTRKKMSEAKKKETYNSKKVVCNGIIYKSISNFIEVNKLNNSIVSWLNGKTSMPSEWKNKGLKYLDEKSNEKIKYRNFTYKYKIEYDNTVFNSQDELANHLNIHPKTISKWFTGETKVPYDIFEKGIKCIGDDISNCVLIPSIAFYYDNILFIKQQDVAKYLGIKGSTISEWVNGKRKISKKYLENGFKIINNSN